MCYTIAVVGGILGSCETGAIFMSSSIFEYLFLPSPVLAPHKLYLLTQNKYIYSTVIVRSFRSVIFVSYGYDPASIPSPTVPALEPFRDSVLHNFEQILGVCVL